MLREVTREEVAKHCTEDDAWVIVEGDVYDVSKFIPMHPGGKQLLAKFAGKDGTEQFQLYHHDGVLRKYGDRLRVGKLQGYAATQGVVPFSEPIWTLRFNSPYYKQTHIDFRARVRKFVNEMLIPSMEEWELEKRPPAKITEEMGRQGFLALMTGADKFPRAYLDAAVPEVDEFDAFHEFILYDELTRCGNGYVMAAITNGPAIALSAIMAYGTEEQRRTCAPDVLMGRKFIALGMSEPNAGSDVASLQTSAVFEDNGRTLRIDGVKKWITNAGYADFIVLACRTDMSVSAQAGTTLILVDMTLPGISVRKLGLGDRAVIASTSYIEFDNVRVPAECIIGGRDNLNKGFRQLMHNLNHERLYLSTLCNRLSRICVEECFKFAMKRKTFGKRLSEHDMIKAKLARMATRVEQTHAWMESIVYQVNTMTREQANENLGDIICGLKAEVGYIYEYCVSETTHIFGGNSLDSRSVGRRIEPLASNVKAYVIPAGATLIMEQQMTKLAIKRHARM